MGGGQSAPTALHRNQPLGWATISHPYHPFHNKKFRILKTRKVSGEDTLILEGTDRGTFAVLRDWTDKADPNLYDSLGSDNPILSLEGLLALTKLIDQTKKRVDSEE